MSEKVYIGLGANLGEPINTIQSAIEKLSNLPSTELIDVSKIYVSKPMGDVEQPDYVNAVALISTLLSPHELYRETSAIEREHGRTRNGEHWGPRTLDLDILLFGQKTLSDSQLTIPHYGLKEREFVVYPLLDIDSTLVLPCGTKLTTIASNLPLNEMKAI